MDTLTCRCRQCGYLFAYLRSDAGRQVECTSCHHSLVLPGNLQPFASKIRRRTFGKVGLSCEIAGVLLVGFWPWGTLAGVVLIGYGWRKSHRWVCSACDQQLPNDERRNCPQCHATFMSE
ncbi:MAG: hypothetical protein SFY81_13330 [Verrucomicrobiota bacterium]|nr:hypothetical protein [Verrucomicrobiota bacterium]